jgi:hypothetical protein
VTKGEQTDLFVGEDALECGVDVEHGGLVCGYLGSCGWRHEYTCIFARRSSDAASCSSSCISLVCPFVCSPHKVSHLRPSAPWLLLRSDRPPRSSFPATSPTWMPGHTAHAFPLTTADALGATYAKAHKWLNCLKSMLVYEYNWTQVPSDDHRILFTLETPSIRKSSVNLPAGPKLRLQLPVHATSFFTPERRVQWQMVFHSDIFESVRKICPPINDILYLIQCLLTGLVTVVLEEQLERQRLPHHSWFASCHMVQQLMNTFLPTFSILPISGLYEKPATIHQNLTTSK